MSDSYIAIDEPVTVDKRADTEQLVVSSTTVERERIQLAGSVDVEITDVHNDAATGAEYGPFVRPVGVTGTGSLTALNSAVTVKAHGLNAIQYEIDTGLVGTVSFEATLDDTNWFAVDAVTLSSGAIVSSVNSFPTRGQIMGAGYSQVRLRVSSYTSGTSSARIEASPSNNEIRVPEVGRIDESEASGDGSVIAILKRARTLLAGGLPSALISNRLDVNVGNNPVLGAGSNNIGDVDVLSLPALPAGTNNIGDVDIASALPAGTNLIGDVIVNDIEDGGGTSVGDTGNNALRVNVVAGSAGGTEYTVNTAVPSTPTGPAILAERDDALGALTPEGDGDWANLRVNGRGAMWTAIDDIQDGTGDSIMDTSNDALRVNIVAGSGGGVTHTDDAAFTPGTDDFVPAGGTYRSVRDQVDDNDAGVFAMTQSRALLVSLETPNADSVMDDTADAVKVIIQAGTNNIGDVDVLTLPSLPAGSNNIGDVDVLSLPALPAGSNNIGDVDVLTLPALVAGDNVIGRVKITDGTEVANVNTNNRLEMSIDEDNVGLAKESGGNLATLAGAVTGTEMQVDVVTLPALPAGTNNIGDVDVLSLPTLPAGDNNIGNVDVVTLPALTTGDNVVGRVKITDGTEVANVNASNRLEVSVETINASIPAGSNNIGDVDIASALPAGDNNIGNVDLVSGPTGAAAIEHQGNAAHDAADTGNPQKIGGKASLNEPTAVADNDRVNAWFDQLGRLVIMPGHSNPESPAVANHTSSGDNTTISAPGASQSLYIQKASVHNRGSSEIVVALRDGAAGTIYWRAELASEGGGSLIDFGARGWKLTANTALVTNLGASGDVDVNVTEYYIAP